MSIFSSIGHAIGNLFGGNDDDKKKKQQQQAAALKAAQKTVAPTNNQIQQMTQASPQQPTNWLNPVKANPNPAPAVLKKANPDTVKTTTQAPAPQKHASILHDITHNPITNAIGTGAKDAGSIAAGTSLGVLRAGEGLAQGVIDIPKLTVDIGTWGGDKLTGTNYRPGYVDAIDKATKEVSAPLDWLSKKTDEAASVYGGPGAKIYKPAQVAANVATLVPAAESLVTKIPGVAAKAAAEDGANVVSKASDFIRNQSVAPTLGKVIPGVKTTATTAADEALAHPVKASDEVEVGIKSANPNQALDAAQQISNSTPPPTPPAPVEETGAHIMSQDEQATLAALTKKSKTAVLAPKEKQVQQLLQAKQDLITQANNPPEPVAAPAPTPTNAPDTTVPPPAPAATPVNPTPVDTSIPESLTQVPAEVSAKPGAVMAPNAPNIQSALEKFSDVSASGGEHKVLNLAESRAQATKDLATIPDKELIATHKDAKVVPSSPQAVFNAVETIRRLEKLSKNPDAASAISNLIDGVAEFESKSGQGLSVANAILEDMPVSMKVNVIIKKIDKLRVAADDDAKFPPIKENKQLEAQVMKNLKTFLVDGEKVKGDIAKTEAAVEKITSDPRKALAKYGSRQAVEERLNKLDKTLTDQSLSAEAKNGETIRYYDSLVPGKANLQRAADWARTTMLTAPTGRLNDVFTTGGNALREAIQSIPQAALGRAVNKAKGAGSVIDSTLLRKSSLQGAKSGLQAAKREFKGELLASDLNSAIKSSSVGGKGGLRRAPATGPLNKIKNLTHAATNFATNLSEGVKRAHLERLARQEGQKAGLTGDELKVYQHGRSLVPSRQMEANAQHLKDTINNLNDNPWSKMVSKFTSTEGSANGKGVAALIQNIIAPFPKYMTTFAWNSITDKNAVAQVVKAVSAARKGDTDALLNHIAGAVTDGSGVAMGYWLTDHGIITNKNAQGYNDDGAYLHIGDRYIPVGFLGFAGGSILAGNAIHNGVKSAGNGLNKIGKIFGDTLANTVRMTGTQSLIGGDNPTVSALQDQFSGQKTVKGGDTASIVGGQVAGQFIPGIFGDVNAGLNASPLNPTHEAADTKVISNGLTATGKPSKAKDVGKSTVKSLENRIPGVSQTLPRKAGVAAPDLIDRTTRGDHETSAEKLVKAQTKSAADLSAANKKAGIPDPAGVYAKGDSFENAVENRVENKKYDQAIGGLQQKLDALKKQPDSTDKQTAPVMKQLATVKALKAGNFDPKIRDTYKSISLSEWRNLGDPESDTYDPEKYQKLFDYDNALVKAGAADANKYSAKTAKGKSGGSKKASTSNTLGSAQTMSRLDLSSLAPKKITNTSIPKIAPILSSDLIKARKISVSKG